MFKRDDLFSFNLLRFWNKKKKKKKIPPSGNFTTNMFPFEDISINLGNYNCYQYILLFSCTQLTFDRLSEDLKYYFKNH